MRWNTMFLLAMLSSMSIMNRGAAAIDFPGPAPGAATARLEGGRLVLENAVLRATWDLSGGCLKMAEFENRLSGTRLGGGAAIRLGLAGGRSIAGSDLPLAGPATLERLAPSPAAVRLADRSAGWRARVPLVSAEGKVHLTWEAVLRDQSNDVRVEASATAPPECPVETLTLVDLPGPDAQVAGKVEGSPIVAGDIFAACEHPLAANRVENGRIVCSVGVFLPSGERSAFSVVRSAVFGVAPGGLRRAQPSGLRRAQPSGQMRRAFLYYLEHERARPYAPLLHYNSWYDIAWGDRKMNEEVCREAIEVFGRELVEKRGVPIDSFVFDDGWDDNRTLWKFHSGFPRGFTPVRTAAEKYHSAVGVWLSPWGGYNQAKQERVAYGREQGFELNRKGFSLAGPRYYQRFREVCLGMVRDYGVNYFKFDGIAQGVSAGGAGGEFASDVDALLRLTGDLRRLRPDLFINITTGTWPSPFWLRDGDSIWRSGGDMGFAGEGSLRQQWINYRDGITYQWIVRRAPLYPLNSLMTQGICHSQLGSASKFSEDLKDFRDEVRSFFASGTQLQELYIRPQMLSPAMWDALAEGASWSRKNADVLADVHWIGGDPKQRQIYGWAAWSPRQGMLALRNPSPSPGSISLDLAAALELPAGAPRYYRLQSPFPGDGTTSNRETSPGVPQVFELAPFEVLVLEAIPIRSRPWQDESTPSKEVFRCS